MRPDVLCTLLVYLALNCIIDYTFCFDTRLVKSKQIFIDSFITTFVHPPPPQSSKGRNLFEKPKIRNIRYIPSLMRQVAESYDYPRIFLNFLHDSQALFLEKFGIVKCCHGTKCSSSEGCQQLPILNLFGSGQPTFSKCAEEIRPRMLTFSAINPTSAIELGYNATDMQLAALPITPQSKVYVLIHGFTDKYHQSGWMRMLRDRMLEGSPVAKPVVIVFDWSRAAQTLFVNKAAASTRTANNVHLIGHSFGAEIAAGAGRAMRKLTGQKLFAITGLDPAGVCISYRKKRPFYCLRYQDAQLVRVLHSDALYFGTTAPIGHFDLYLNGGVVQPQCYPHANAVFNPEAIITGLSCSHFRVVRLMLTLFHTYSDCQPIAYECSSYDAFLRGRCATCHDQRCVYFGYEEQIGWSGMYRVTPVTAHKKMFIKTDSEPPFCLSGILILTAHAHEPVKVQFVNEPTTLLTLPGNRPATRFTQFLLQNPNSPFSALSVTRIEINYLSHLDPVRRKLLSTQLCPVASSSAAILFRLCSI